MHSDHLRPTVCGKGDTPGHTRISWLKGSIFGVWLVRMSRWRVDDPGGSLESSVCIRSSSSHPPLIGPEASHTSSLRWASSPKGSFSCWSFHGFCWSHAHFRALFFLSIKGPRRWDLTTFPAPPVSTPLSTRPANAPPSTLQAAEQRGHGQHEGEEPHEGAVEELRCTG